MEISRSAKKRQLQQVEKLAAALVELPSRLHSRLPCDDELTSEIRRAVSMKGGARQRQIKFVTRLLQRCGAEDALLRFLEQHRGRDLAEIQAMHQAESWRDALIDEALARFEEEGGLEETAESPVLQELGKTLPVDTRALALLAQRFAATREPRYSREIFRALRAALAERERGG